MHAWALRPADVADVGGDDRLGHELRAIPGAYGSGWAGADLEHEDLSKTKRSVPPELYGGYLRLSSTRNPARYGGAVWLLVSLDRCK